MPYGTLKIDTITFTDAGVDKSIAVSGLVQNPTFTGNVTATGTVSGATVRATTVSGVTVSGTTANFASGVYTTQISGAIVKVPAGTPGAPSFQVGTGASVAPGLYCPATDQLGISTGGAFRLVVDSTGRVGIGTSSPSQLLHVTGNAVVGGSPAIQYGELTTVGTIAIQRANPFLHFVDAAGSTRFGYIQHTGTGGDFYLLNQETGALRFGTSNGERARIDSSGRLLVGTSSSITAVTFPAQVQTNSFYSYSASLFSADAFGSNFLFLKSRNATTGSHTVVQANDVLGQTQYAGSDGTAFITGAAISAVVDGTPGLNDMPGRLVFSTTADGASSPTEKMRIDNAGNITWNGAGIKLTTGRNIASTADTSSINILGGDITTNTGANIELYGGTHATFPNLMVLDADEHRFRTANGATERMRIDSSGRLLVGTSASITTLVQAGLQAHGTGALGYINSGRWSNDINRSELIFSKSRGGTVGTRALVSADDGLGGVTFTGDDGASFVQAANIIAYVDGTPGTNDMPGRLVFSTTADGASTPTERMRIDSAGNITTSTGILTLGATGGEGGQLVINNTTNTGGVCFLDAKDDTTARLFTSLNNSTLQIGQLVGTGGNVQLWTGATERARIDSSGRVGIGTSSPGAILHTTVTSAGAATIGAFLQNSSLTAGTEVRLAFAPNINSVSDNRYSWIGALNVAGSNDSALTFATAPGGAPGIERMRIDSAGNVGIGGTPGSYKLDVQGGVQRILNQGSTSALEIGNGTTTSQTAHIDLTTDTTYTDFGLRLIRDGAGGANGISQLQQKGTGELSLRCIEAAPLTFYTTNTERARIDSSGRLLVGTSSARTSFFGGTVTPVVQLEQSSLATVLSVVRNSADNGDPIITLCKTRGTVNGSNTIVAADDFLGGITFQGADGANLFNGASIRVNVDGTPGLNSMPGRIVFNTTPSGSTSSAEQLRITNGGTVVYNQPAPAAVDVTATLTVANLTAKIITSTTAAAVTMTLPTGTLMDGGFSGLYNNMAFEWTIINTGGTNAVTVQAGASHTLVGSGTVTANGSGRFLSRRTAATTWVTYRLAT